MLHYGTCFPGFSCHLLQPRKPSHHSNQATYYKPDLGAKPAWTGTSPRFGNDRDRRGFYGGLSRESKSKSPWGKRRIHFLHRCVRIHMYIRTVRHTDILPLTNISYVYCKLEREHIFGSGGALRRLAQYFPISDDACWL